MNKSLEVVVGAQFGSEAKGHVVQRLTERAQNNAPAVQVIRVAGPNAGHTGYDATGRRWALRQVPVAAVTEGPVVLGIAAGSEVDIDVLLDEIDQLTEAGLMANKMLWVSSEATLVKDRHKDIEAGHQFIGAGGLCISDPMTDADDLTKSIGSTGKGIGAARADRLLRGAQRVQDHREVLEMLAARGVAVAHTQHRTIDGVPDGGHVIIEGTQGYGLGLHAGFYPQCTSSDCRAIDFLSMAGINPWQFNSFKVWAVARIFPIRVAGNSGPLRGETTWEALGLPEERTTVTQKIRRVGAPDWNLVHEAVKANGGHPTVSLALTMVDQMFPEARDQHLFELDPDVLRRIDEYADQMEREVRAPIELVATGPNTMSTRESHNV